MERTPARLCGDSMPYDKQSFLAGVAAGRNMESWPAFEGGQFDKAFSFTIDTRNCQAYEPAGRHYQFRCTTAEDEKVYIYWGDGTQLEECSRSGTDRPVTHDYDSPGVYTILLFGELLRFGDLPFCDTFLEDCLLSVNSPLPIKKDIGSGGVLQLGGYFYDCSNLTYVHESVFEAYADTLFSRCIVSNIFQGCTSLDEISGTVFYGLPPCSSIRQIFAGCQALTEIPNGIFNSSIFDDVTSMESAFQGCSSLQDIPSGLYSRFLNCTNYSRAFEGCTSLISVGDLFENCVSGADFSYVFEGCQNLESIGEGMFSGCVSANSFEAAFANCSSLKDIPQGLFDDQDQTRNINFRRCFERDSMIKSAVPELWTLFPNAQGAGCFTGCSRATNYADIPYPWRI